MNIGQIVTGGIKMGIETNNYINHPKEFSLSAMIDGGVLVGAGGSWLVYNSYLSRTAAKLAIRSSTVEHAIDMLRAQVLIVPTKILWATRLFGSVGPAIAGATSVYTIYDGATNETLSPEERRHKKISGSIGLGSSIFGLGFAYLMVGGAIPIGSACLAGSMGLLAIQTVYDEWDDIKWFFTDYLAQKLSKAQKTYTASMPHPLLFKI